MDGAGAWFTFKTLTLPMLKPFMYCTVIQAYGCTPGVWDYICPDKGRSGDTLMNISLTGYLNGFYLSETGSCIALSVDSVVSWHNKAAVPGKTQRHLAQQAAGKVKGHMENQGQLADSSKSKMFKILGPVGRNLLTLFAMFAVSSGMDGGLCLCQMRKCTIPFFFPSLLWRISGRCW